LQSVFCTFSAFLFAHLFEAGAAVGASEMVAYCLDAEQQTHEVPASEIAQKFAKSADVLFLFCCQFDLQFFACRLIEM